ncbi:MAG TPA: DUF4331 domain-containing protein [Solirubrobacteraceae bacterium]|jgi:hypothetical protein|nr:DUF4331 domain-containing protein [Solirubrobacteraceae bacterium]
MRFPRRAGAFRLLALTAALAASFVAVSLSSGSSHREAPGTALDPTADNTDLYAFTANDAPGSLTIVSNWIPFEDPAGGPNFYRFDDRAVYWISIDNAGDGKYHIRYRFNFKTQYRNPSSFLYALPGVSSIGDPKLQVLQTYTVTRLVYSGNGHVSSSQVLARNVPVAPNNAGPKTFPNYNAVANQAITPLGGGGKVFAGQVDDPFFVDLGTTFDAINFRNGTGNAGGGKDDLAGYNVHTIAIQVPDSQVTRDGQPVTSPSATNAVVGVWTSTDRRRLEVQGSNTTTAVAKGPKASKGYVQVSRLGNPLINELLIPVGLKDKFNATQPKDDLKNFGTYALNPEPARIINTLFNLGVPTTNRTDLVNALLVGLPGKTMISPNAVPADTLKINLGVPPSATPNRFGVIGGDLAGFPDGRRLSDDVVDITLRVVGGFLVGHQLPLGDGVDHNDVPFRSAFPYVAPPHDGFTSAPKRFEPTHAPTPANLQPATP